MWNWINELQGALSSTESLIGIAVGAVALAASVRGWLRRRARKREEAALAVRDTEDRRVADYIRKTVMEEAQKQMIAAVTKIISDHAAAADAQVQRIAAAIGSMASSVEQTCERLEKRVDSCHERMDDFLRALAAGQMPHYRAQPRVLDALPAPERQS